MLLAGITMYNVSRRSAHRRSETMSRNGLGGLSMSAAFARRVEMSTFRLLPLLPLIVTALLFTLNVWSQAPSSCAAMPDHDKLRASLVQAVKEGAAGNGGLGNQEWAAVVDRDGIVCAVVFSGPDRRAEWPGSRMIAAEKASTANALSGPNFALSTANLYASAQPGGSLFGIVTAAPPNPQAAYAGKADDFGQSNDPLVGKPVGGIIVFAGGLALYTTALHYQRTVGRRAGRERRYGLCGSCDCLESAT
jgi:hypothetical protein